MITTRAHTTLRHMQHEGAFALRPLAQRLGIYPTSLLYILGGSIPKVTVALGLQRELGIDIADWDVAAGVEETQQGVGAAEPRGTVGAP